MGQSNRLRNNQKHRLKKKKENITKYMKQYEFLTCTNAKRYNASFLYLPPSSLETMKLVSSHNLLKLKSKTCGDIDQIIILREEIVER